MTIHKIAGALNGVAALLQGGCKALAEDSKDAFFEVRQAFKAGNVCIMVATPKVTRAASGAPRKWRLLWRAFYGRSGEDRTMLRMPCISASTSPCWMS